jgi:integrase
LTFPKSNLCFFTQREKRLESIAMMNLSALIAQFLAFVKVRQAARTHEYYNAWLARFLKHVGDMPVAEVKRHHLLTYARSWYEYQTVQRLFRWACVEMEIVAANPFTNIQRPPLGNRRRVLSRAETIALQRGSDRTFRPFLIALIETAARPQEIRAARWDQLRDCNGLPSIPGALARPGGWIELHDFKARTRRRNPHAVRLLFLSDRLRRLLARLWDRVPIREGEIFRNARGETWNRNSLRCRMRRLRDRLGLRPDGTGERIVLYTLRHSAATDLAAAGIGEHALADVLGHTSTRTTQRYVHLQRDALRRAFHESRNRARKERWR